ncbi:MAG TPA: HAD-IA family hydrolase [Pyrinomonadaceae bacterium]|nr:HAD-IA family hydrolase [Pyrinomonadaceae bacterium]
MSQKTASINTLLFDWDGTLVDSAQLSLIAFEQSFATLGINFDREIYARVYSPNWYSVYEAMGLPPDQWQRADELWIQHYGEQNAQLVEGAKSTIAALKEQNYRLGVVSSGSVCRVTREIKESSVAEFFEVVVCNEQMENKKPHPEGLDTALRALGCTPEQSAYVGDSPEDIEMGKRAKMLTVGVRSEYPTSWKLESYDPDIFLKSFNELLDHF